MIERTAAPAVDKTRVQRGNGLLAALLFVAIAADPAASSTRSSLRFA